MIWPANLEHVSGKKRCLHALFYGVLAAAAFAPFKILPVLWISFPALIYLLRGCATKKSAFAVGWCFAFGLLVPNMYWIAAALFIDIGYFWWALPFAVCGLPAALALYYGLAAMVARKLSDMKALGGVLIFALLWFLADVARGTLLTGFPWDVMGYVWAEFLPMAQVASLVGVYGLSLITVVLACLPVAGLNAGVAVAQVMILFALIGWGQWRIHQPLPENVPDVRLRLVQTSSDQAHKWQEEWREKNFSQLLDLSFAPADKPVTHVIWPETATAFFLAEDRDARNRIAARMHEGQIVLTGVVRRAMGTDSRIHYYNSLIAIDQKARVIAGYDKFHLVPFGEYVPWRDLLPIHKLTAVGVDFTPGDGVRSLRVPALPPFSALVCYEAVFSGEVVEHDDPPQLMINVTNDGWYDGTIGPRQHFAIVRMRAIEEGIPLVRVANVGIAGVVDGYGRVKTRLEAHPAGFIDSDLPKANSEPTLFSRFGALTYWGLFGVVLALAVGAEWKRRKAQ